MSVGEFLTSNTGISYPFRQDQNLPEQIIRTFVDASVFSSAFDAAISEVVYRIETGVLSFKFGDMEVESRVSGKSGFGVVGDSLNRFVIDFDYINGIDSFTFEGPAKLEPSCVDPGLDCITSIELYNGEGDPRNAVISGDVVMMNGYNVDMSSDANDTIVRIEASPGYGLGKVPCDTSECDNDPETDGTAIPDENGNAVIAGDGCYEVTAEGSTLKIHGKCVACCQCQMYVDIVDELRVIAERVSDVKKKTNDNTDWYFNTVEKFSVDSGRAAVDIQMDIAPDATILQKASVPEGSFNDFNSFRVTCTVTNISGVPCVITVPDMWSGSEYSELYRSAPHSVLSRTGIRLDKPGYFMEYGIAPYFSGNTAFIVDRKYIPSRLYYHDFGMSNIDNDNGWTYILRSRGPAMRTRDEKNPVKYYNVMPFSVSPYESLLNAKFDYVKSALSEYALFDLNHGKNPSGMLDYAEEMTHTYSDGLGFIMPAGYSFTITGLFSLPGDALGSIQCLGASFSCAIFCPMLAYSMAYNHARPVTDVVKKGGDYYVNTTWEHGRNEDAAISKGSLTRRYYVEAEYSIKDGTMSFRHIMG
jgi:hypothetical protein